MKRRMSVSRSIYELSERKSVKRHRGWYNRFVTELLHASRCRGSNMCTYLLELMIISFDCLKSRWTWYKLIRVKVTQSAQGSSCIALSLRQYSSVGHLYIFIHFITCQRTPCILGKRDHSFTHSFYQRLSDTIQGTTFEKYLSHNLYE